jgi:hypothetical protein
VPLRVGGEVGAGARDPRQYSARPAEVGDDALVREALAGRRDHESFVARRPVQTTILLGRPFPQLVWMTQRPSR